jgi:hypothetical protein
MGGSRMSVAPEITKPAGSGLGIATNPEEGAEVREDRTAVRPGLRY